MVLKELLRDKVDLYLKHFVNTRPPDPSRPPDTSRVFNDVIIYHSRGEMCFPKPETAVKTLSLVEAMATFFIPDTAVERVGAYYSVLSRGNFFFLILKNTRVNRTVQSLAFE